MMSGDADSVAKSGGLIVIGNSYYSNYRGLVSIYRASDGVLLSLAPRTSATRNRR